MIGQSENIHSMFPPWSNLVRIKPGGYERLYRYLCADEKFVYVMKLGDGPPKNDGTREAWRRDDVAELMLAKRLWRVQERGVPDAMRKLQVPRGKDDELDEKRDVIEYIEATAGDGAITNKKVYCDIVKRAAELFEKSKPTIRKWYRRHLYYGGHENANVDHDWQKGAPGVSRRNVQMKKGKRMGRPTDNERLDPNTTLHRKRLPTRLLARWARFIEEDFCNGNQNISITLDRFFLSLRGFNQGTDGNGASYPVDPAKLPERYLMLAEGRKIRKDVKLRKLRAGEKHHANMLAPRRGNAESLANQDLSVLDLDGTEFDNYLRFGSATISIDGQGKPLVMLAVDRGSRAVVGWYVSFGTENGNAYRNLLFSAYTPKERELLKWGVPHLTGMVYGSASQVFVDRGPGISEAVQEAVVNRLRADMLMAKPGMGRAKGDVENVMGLFQAALSGLIGSSHGSGNKERDKQKKKDAPKLAVLTLEVFMRALLTAISRHNLMLNVSNLMSKEMLEDDSVKPCPKEIYLWNKSMRGGDAAWDWPEETIYRRLNEPFSLPAPRGTITLGSRQFTSTLLKELAERYEAAHSGKAMMVSGYELANSPLHLVWEMPDGNLGALEATERSDRIYGDGYRWLHDFITMSLNAAARKVRYRNRHAPTVSQAVDSEMGKVDGVKNRQQSKGGATKAKKAANEMVAHTHAKMTFDALNVGGPDSSRTATAAIVGFGGATAEDDEQVLNTDF